MTKQLRSKIYYIQNSLITRFIIILLLLSIFPFFLLLKMITGEITSMEEQRLYENFGENLEIMSMNIDNCLAAMESLHAALLLDDGFLRNINSLGPADSSPPYSDLKTARDIRNTLTTTSARSNELLNIYIYWPETGRLLISNENTGSDYRYHDLSATAWYIAYMEQMQSFSPWVRTESLRSEEKIFSSYRNLMSVIVSFNISEKKILNIMYQSNPYPYASSFLIDSKGNIIGGTQEDNELCRFIQQGLEKEVLSDSRGFEWEKRRYCLSVYQSDYSGMTLVLYAPREDCISTENGTHAIVWLYMANAALLLILTIVLAYTIFVKPLQLLSCKMQQSEHGNLSVRLPEKQRNEIGQIYHRFNQMNASIHRLIEDNYVSEIHKKDFEIRLLGAQINEHFLYNALDAIHWLARQNHLPEVGASIHSLAAFYRISLSCGSDRITIRNLVEMLDSYLRIQKLLLGDALNYEIDVPLELQSYKVPKYLFVPLLDNAVRHGIKGMDEGIICISVSLQGEGLRFCVTDNGRGISPERQRQIRNALKENSPDNEDCFALKNLNAQLMLYFNDQQGIQFDSKEKFGSSFWFYLPIDKEVTAFDTNDDCR